MEKQSKLSLFTLTCMCIGAIIGAGIFGSLPKAVVLAGPAIIIVFLIAAIEIIVRYLPSIVPSTAIPATSGFYMHLSRLINPYVGFLQIINILFYVFLLALLSSVFAQYFNMIVKVNSTLVEIMVLAVFGTIGYFGVKTGAKIQNVMVIVLIIALGLYIALGLPHVDEKYFTIGKAFSMEGLTFSSFGAALGLTASCLMGGTSGVHYAEELDNPGKTIVQSFLISTFFVALIYVLMGIVTVGVIPSSEVTSLGAVAEKFMPKTFYLFFIAGGALFALATTINSVMIASVANLGVFARDKVLPDVFNNKNKYGISIASVLLATAGSIFVVIFKLPVGTLMSVTSVLGILIALAQFLTAIEMPKRYPNCYKYAPIKIPMKLVYGMIAISVVFCIYEGYSLIVSTKGPVWITVLATVVISYGYFFMRIAYLRKKGIDLIAIMSTPYEPWEEKERILAQRAVQGEK